MAITSGICKTDGTYQSTRSTCSELQSIIVHFKKNFGRKQPDSFVATMLKWTAKTTSYVLGLDEKVTNKAINSLASKTNQRWISKGGLNASKVFFSVPAQIISGVLEPSTFATGTSILKEKIDELLYLVGEGAYYNRHQINRAIMMIKHGADQITIEQEWGNSPECYRTLNHFVKDVERAVNITLRDNGPKLQATT